MRRVETLLNLADLTEKRVAAAASRANKLIQAILAKAFRGELVFAEAELARREGRDYESASTLLARIRALQPTPRTRPTTPSSLVEAPDARIAHRLSVLAHILNSTFVQLR